MNAFAGTDIPTSSAPAPTSAASENSFDPMGAFGRRARVNFTRTLRGFGARPAGSRRAVAGRIAAYSGAWIGVRRRSIPCPRLSAGQRCTGRGRGSAGWLGALRPSRANGESGSICVTGAGPARSRSAA